MEYFRTFQKAVGWNWVRIPGIIVSVLSGGLIIARQSGLIAMEQIPVSLLVGVSVATIIIWFLGGLLHHCVVQSREIESLHRAWDRTGKYDVPIRKAVQFIYDYLGKTESGDKVHDRYKRAAAKIRELGWENQIRIVGREYDEDSGTYEDFSKAIPAHFWNANRLDIEVLLNHINELPQTITDEKYVLDVGIQPKFGQIQISEATLKAMFPSSS